MFQTSFKIFALLSACVHMLTVAQTVIGLTPPYAAALGPVFIPGPFPSYPIQNTFLPATSFSQSATASSASQPVFPNAASASYSQSSVSGFPSTIGFNPPYAASGGSVFLPDPFSGFPVVNPFFPVTSYSQNSAISSSSLTAFPGAASTSYSQSSSSDGATSNPSISLLANSFLQVLPSSNILNDFIDFELPGSAARNLFNNIGNELLLNFGIIDTSLVDLVVQAVGSNDFITPTFYFNSVSNTLGRFLLSRGLLTPETATTFPQSLLQYVENAAISRGVSNTESLISSVAEGFFNYISSLGFSLRDVFPEIVQIFAEELTS